MSEVITTRSAAVQTVLNKKDRIHVREKKEEEIIERVKERAIAKEKEKKEEKKADPQNHIVNAWDEIKETENVRSRHFPPQSYYTHQKLCEKYPNNTWSGKRCFIIGGGHSLRDFNFSILDKELTIAINRAQEFLDPSIIFFTDYETFFLKLMRCEFGIEARRRFLNSQALKIALNVGGYDINHGVFSVPLSRDERITFDLRDGLFDGDNSGFAALNLAVCLGCNPIYLLGYDMKGDGKGNQSWFHDGYKNAPGERVYKNFIRHFEESAEEIKKKNIKVINLNGDSNLKCFEFGSIDNIQDLTEGFEYVPDYDSTIVIPYKYENLYFQGVSGFGDNFYQRPIIKDLAKSYKNIYLETAFPEIYWDIENIEFIYPRGMTLRTQLKHIKDLPKKMWSDLPKKVDTVRWDQVGPPSEPKIQTKYVELENDPDFNFTFPVKTEWITAARKLVKSLDLDGKKLCVIRRPTNREEWNCTSRNPRIEYYQLLIDRYCGEYYFLSLADIAKGEEWFEGDLFGLDKEFNHGEIPLTTILGLIAIADMTITYPSFFMIAAIAMRARCFCIFGGTASPESVLRKNLDLSNFSHVSPDVPCDCREMNHECNKEIDSEKIIARFNELKVREKVEKIVTVGVPPGIGDSYWVLTKMESFKKKNGIDKLRIAVHRDPIHFYTAEFLKLLPFVDEVVEKKDHFAIKDFYDPENPKDILRNEQEVDYLMDAGAKMWLKGIHLENILKGYETNYSLPIEFSEEAQKFASDIKKRNEKLVLFFTSSLGANSNWNRDEWRVEDWMSLAVKIYNHSDIRPVVVGAKWDRDYFDSLKTLDENNILQDFVGGIEIQQTLSLIKQADLVISFACGIPIFAVYNDVPTVIFWATRGVSKCDRFDPSFQYTWAPKSAEKSDRYMPVAYGHARTKPGKIFERIKKFL